MHEEDDLAFLGSQSFFLPFPFSHPIPLLIPSPSGYATYLLVIEPPRCTTPKGDPWQPAELIAGLVWSTWALLAGILLLLFVTYNLFPDYSDPKSWEKQCMCLGFALCCWGQMDRVAAQHDRSVATRLGRIMANVRRAKGVGHADA